jgi:hypothetical protein
MAARRSLLLLPLALGLAATSGCGTRTGLLAGEAVPVVADEGGSGLACARAPQPKVLYAANSLRPDLTGDGRRLYALRPRESGGGSDVLSVDPCSGAAKTLGRAVPLSSADPPVVPFRGRVYWVDAPGTGATQDLFRSDPLAGPPERLMSLGTEVDALAFTGTVALAVAFDGTLLSLPLGGGTGATLVADALPSNPFVDGGFVYYARLSGGIGRIALTGGTVVTLGPAEQTCVGPNSLRAIAADDEALYTVSRDSYQLWRIRKDGAASLLTTLSWCSQIALDDDYVYFTDSASSPAGGRVSRIAKAGGSVEVLATGTDAWGIYADATSVYWIDFGRGRLMKVDK